jgi:hypothetical protein
MAFSALHDWHHWQSWLRVKTQTSLVEKLQPVLFQAAAEADGPEAIRSTNRAKQTVSGFDQCSDPLKFGACPENTAALIDVNQCTGSAS